MNMKDMNIYTRIKCYINLLMLIGFGIAGAIKLYNIKFFGVYELIPYSIGFILALSGQFYFTVLKKWHGELTKPGEELWTGGPFAIVRHPFMGGVIIMFLTVVGANIRHQNMNLITAGLNLIVLIWFIMICISQEKELIKSHGKEARDYFSKVRKRWIPFII